MDRTDFSYRVRYRIETFHESTTLLHDNFSCIEFINRGEVPVIINGNIVLNTGEAQHFNEKPYVVIDTDFNIIFDVDSEGTKALSCICSYYEQN